MRMALTIMVALVGSLGLAARADAPDVPDGREAAAAAAVAQDPGKSSGSRRAVRVASAPDWRPRVLAARAFARTRLSRVSFAVRTEERLWGFRERTAVPSASVIKAMLLVAYLRRPDVRGRPLRADERALLRPMIRVSDNDAASRVRDLVGADLTDLARTARMARFRADPWWGRSTVDAADQTRFFLALERLTPRRHRAFALAELAGIVPSQRWGIAAVRPRGWRLHFKGGWGSGSGAVDHQVGLLVRGEERVAVAIMTTGNPSHEYGTATLEGVARRLLEGLARAPEPEAEPPEETRRIAARGSRPG